MLTDYERYQLEWMIEHGHSLDELMEELTNYQNDLESVPGVNLTVSDVFDSWTSNRGFEALENDTITKDMVRAGIEHGVIRFEANPDPNDPWKTVCAIGNGWFYHVDTTDILPEEYIQMNSNNVDMVVDEIYDELNSKVKNEFHDDYERYLAELSKEHHGGVNSLTGVPFDINEAIEDGGAYYNPETGVILLDLSGHEGLESGIQSLDIKKTDNVREWYMLAFPTDGLGAEINPQLTFDDALSAVPTGNGFYSALGTGPDSVVRERVFEELCNRYGYTYDDIYGSWFDKTPLPGLESRSPQPEKIAIAAGYRFNLVDAREAAGIDLKGCGTVVTVDGHDYDVMKGATYEDSRKVDDLLDSHGDKPISGYRKQPQGMSLKQAAMESREASAKLAEKNGGTDDHDGKDER